ncbi:MAG: methyl-accepting chemotaxis protein [Undibacterium sp.]|uniref:methyl-accepting chemotaxis protein n=1 Tax=Undibacterium sp. TaxID=1914977 RepID=UPI0027240009|nr:methyl-accepting chemotaxis protein [Undibacterium sp.]MDO8654652.1 methyl-accepting chemotaxis protein [Undibacterium sp.]
MSLNQIHNLSIAKRLGILILSAVLGIVVLTSIFLFSEKSLIIEERQSSVRQTVEVAHSLIVYYHGLIEQTKMSEDDAKQSAMKAIKALRYGDGEYIWINNMQTVMVMHPIKPELDGKDLSGSKDANGKLLFTEFVEMVKAKGAGFVFYMWPKPGHDNPVQKVSYVKGFAPWGWVVGSGVYIDTVDAALKNRFIESSIGALILAAVLFGIGLFIARGLVRQLGGEPQYAAEITRHIAEGDLTVVIDLKKSDQSSLLFSIKSMRDSIAAIIGQVRSGTDAIAMSSKEIASGNMDLSARTETQASSLEETASSMEELTGTVKQNADNARQANQLAASASSIAIKGGNVVAEVVATMGVINSSSQKIVDIISVIDGIAFQTNILALNAAVEAARAGEQGRGFAVVASEVRNLAQRSASAAKEIKTLINDSVENVRHGSQLVDQAGGTMNEIVASVKHVTDIMAEITAATTEQTSGIEQINLAISEMDSVTQQNAALVEQAAAAAAAMQEQAGNLMQVVSVFKVDANADAGQENLVMQQQDKVKTKAAPRAVNVTKRLNGVKSSSSAKSVTARPAKKNVVEDDWEEF